mmetsp:Transcript_7166/g.14400  ORF Transcript_7166/g.14400 Transcript_7166/m.14400 type:complete len:109 (+) Transcript_7166:171-497(+)
MLYNAVFIVPPKQIQWSLTCAFVPESYMSFPPRSSVCTSFVEFEPMSQVDGLLNIFVEQHSRQIDACTPLVLRIESPMIHSGLVVIVADPIPFDRFGHSGVVVVGMKC